MSLPTRPRNAGLHVEAAERTPNDVSEADLHTNILSDAACTADSHPADVGWVLSCSDGAPLRGGAPYASVSPIAVEAESMCALSMSDSGGDGCSGAAWTVPGCASRDDSMSSGSSSSEEFEVQPSVRGASVSEPPPRHTVVLAIVRGPMALEAPRQPGSMTVRPADRPVQAGLASTSRADCTLSLPVGTRSVRACRRGYDGLADAPDGVQYGEVTVEAAAPSSPAVESQRQRGRRRRRRGHTARSRRPRRCRRD